METQEAQSGKGQGKPSGAAASGDPASGTTVDAASGDTVLVHVDDLELNPDAPPEDWMQPRERIVVVEVDAAERCIRELANGPLGESKGRGKIPQGKGEGLIEHGKGKKGKGYAPEQEQPPLLLVNSFEALDGMLILVTRASNEQQQQLMETPP